MVLIVETVQTASDAFQCQLPIGGLYGHQRTTCTFDWSSAFIHIYVGRLGTKYSVVRPGHQLQGDNIAPCTIEYVIGFTLFAECLFKQTIGGLGPRIVTVTVRVICISLHKGFHHGWMDTRVIVRSKTAHT